LESIQESENYAKQAINVNVSSARAWYTLGNAVYAAYFETRSSSALVKLLKAYKRAEVLYMNAAATSPHGSENPDLFYNRAGVFSFILHFEEALQDLEKCLAIDPSLSAAVKQARINILNTRIRLKRLLTLKLFANSQEIAKCRQDLIDSPLIVGSQGFADSAESARLFACKIIAAEPVMQSAAGTQSNGTGSGPSNTNNDDHRLVPPHYFLCVDSAGKFGILALFDVDATDQLTLFIPGAIVVVADPQFVFVDVQSVSSDDVGSKNAGNVGDICPVIKMTERSKMRVDGLQLNTVSKSTGLAPIVSETF
jgi:hypothetical protein